MNNIQKIITELNLLGSFIEEDDSFHKFLDQYREDLFNPLHKFEIEDNIDFNSLKKALESALLPHLQNKKPVILLSGGIDSTVLAHILFLNNISFEAISFFISENDPSIGYVEYLEKVYGIKSKKYFLNYDKLRHIYDHYFENYQSPNLDYAFLSMCSLMTEYGADNKDNGNTVFIDGIEGDNLFGYNNNFKLKLKSNVMWGISSLFPNNKIHNSRRANIYTSSLINDSGVNSLYQNFVFPKLLTNSGTSNAADFVNSILVQNDKKNLSFHSRNMLGMLYYMGRRVAYKNYHPIMSNNNSVLYPFTNGNVLKFGFALKNKLKVKPVVKAPLKIFLEQEGYNKDFIYSPKRGMGFDLFKVLNYEDVQQSLELLTGFLEFKKVPDSENYLYKLYKNRDKAVDHFLFGLVISARYIKHKYA